MLQLAKEVDLLNFIMLIEHMVEHACSTNRHYELQQN